MKRTLIITSRAHIAVENRCLCVTIGEEVAVFPPGDLGVVILESRQATITSSALSLLCASGTSVISCDERHMPIGIATPVGIHYEMRPLLDLQIAASKPLLKQLWRAIVMAKIENQSAVLSLAGRSDSELAKMPSCVRSGDATNRESVAASIYFRSLICEGTRRDSEYTAFLDYGYAVIRAAVARELVAHGFAPQLGIHHRNSRNAYALADDLMEPYRPFVDLLVFAEAPAAFDAAARRRLASVLESVAVLEGQRTLVQSSIEASVESLRRALEKGDPGELLLPEIEVLDRPGI